jgi:hypothetical protein
MRNIKFLRITSMSLFSPIDESPHAFDWLPALLRSTSPTCRESVERVHLSFALQALKDMDCVAWGEIECALSLTCFPRLQNIYLQFIFYTSEPTQAQVAKRLTGLASRGAVEIVVDRAGQARWD